MGTKSFVHLGHSFVIPFMGLSRERIVIHLRGKSYALAPAEEELSDKGRSRAICCDKKLQRLLAFLRAFP